MSRLEIMCAAAQVPPDEITKAARLAARERFQRQRDAVQASMRPAELAQLQELAMLCTVEMHVGRNIRHFILYCARRAAAMKQGSLSKEACRANLTISRLQHCIYK